MRILTNDYLSNLPGSELATKGGPPLFARNFSDAAVSAGHEWLGIVTSSTAPAGSYEEVIDGKKRFFVMQVSKETRDLLADTSVEHISPDIYEEDVALIEKIISDIRPDVLFLNGFSVHAWTIAEAAFRARIPVAIQHAGILTKEFDIYRDWFSTAACDFTKSIEGEVAAKAAANIFLNEYSRDAFMRFVEPESLSNPIIIPLPHAGWPFEKILNADRTERVLGIVARWDRIKNQEAVLALAQEIQRRGLPWRIRSVTTIPKTTHHAERKEKYRAAVEVVPPMEREALRAFYESLDALILPSHFDVSPTVVMEGIAMGKPTFISPNVGWVSEYEAAGMDRWILDFADPAAAVTRLEEQFALPSWPETAAFSSYVETHHDPKAVYREYLSLFERIAL